MAEALRFFRAFEVWIYILLGLGGLIYIRKFIIAWQDMRTSGFGLERESAQARLNQSASVLVLLLTMAVTEFVLVSYIAPAVPGAIPLLTPTLNLLATPTITLPASTQPITETQVSPTPVVTLQPGESGCIPGQVEVLIPKTGDEVRAVVTITGTVDLPDFGFYKLEMKHPEEANWLTIQAGDSVVQNGKLGDWDTRRLVPGEYQLGLVVVDNQARASPPCVVQVRVSQPLEETPGP